MSLSASNTKRVSEGEVRVIPAPQFTDTWRPVSHASVLDVLAKACYDLGIGVTRREYSVNRSGSRMFGVWDLDYVINGTCYSLGFRNAIDMSFALGMCGGLRVAVCDNLELSGDFKVFSRHTSGLTHERMIEMSESALTGAFVDMRKLEQRQQSLMECDLDYQEFAEITFDLMKSNVVPPAQFNKFLTAHDEERDLRCHSRSFTGKDLSHWYGKDSSMHTVHNAVTRLMRPNSLFTIASKSKKLISVCDDYMLKKAA